MRTPIVLAKVIVRKLLVRAVRAKVMSRAPGRTLQAFGQPRPLAEPLARASLAAPLPRPVGDGVAQGLVLATTATVSHLGAAFTAISTFKAYHPEARVLLLVVDAVEAPKVEDPSWTVMLASELGVSNFDWLALKYNATELSCAMKPFLMKAALQLGDRAIYCDADIAFFARCDAMIDALDHHDFVLTPHILEPMPDADRYGERPTTGSLAQSGQMNAGLFALRRGPEADRFLATFASLCTQAGAFYEGSGPSDDQNALNWLPAFADKVRILRDSAYNVAYWNLHDRSLRWKGLDDPDRTDCWEVDTRPLVCFHYSGYNPYEPLRLSRYDTRNSLYNLPSVERILRYYDAELAANGAAIYGPTPYRFSHLADGTPLDARIRTLLKKYEPRITPPTETWTMRGAAEVGRLLMSPAPGSSSLLPLAFTDIYDRRPDLRQIAPDADLQPTQLWEWIASHGVRELKLAPWFDRHRQVLCSPQLTSLVSTYAGVAESIGSDALGQDRLAFAAALDTFDLNEGDRVRRCSEEIPIIGSVGAILEIHQRRPDLQKTFPEPLNENLDAFCVWLSTHGRQEYGLDASAIEHLRSCARGASLVRIFSYLKRTEYLNRAFPLGLIGEHWHGLARHLVAVAAENLDYDLDDALVFIWTMRNHSAEGLPYLLELPHNRRARVSPRTEAGARAIIGDRLDHPAFANEFRRYVRNFGFEEIDLEDAYFRVVADDGDEFDVFTEINEAGQSQLGSASRTHAHASSTAKRLDSRPTGSHAPRFPAFGPGVNMFGYFASAIGVGQSTWGISEALDAAHIPQTRQVMTNAVMNADTTLQKLIEHYRYDYGTNLFVSFTHARESVLKLYPKAYVQGRRNITYLAWEQRDWSELWRPVYDRYDDIWVISEFAAAPLRRLFGDRVKAVSNVLDVATLPPAASKAEVGLDAGRFTFLYIFDANSSIERKNPEAAVEAFGKAFAGTSNAGRVELVLKVGNAARPSHAARIQALRAAAAATGLRVRFIGEMMSRNDLMRLVSAADCYVSLHRSEGFGYTCAEAMAYGRPVIATNYSGNLAYMDSSSALLVDAEEELVRRSEGPFTRGSVWARPDVDHAAELMRLVLTDAGLRRRLGAAARQAVIDKLSPQVVGAQIAELLGHAPAPSRTRSLAPVA